MKLLAIAFVAVQAAFLQASAIPIIASGPSQVISPGNSVAYNLADTLNLLTVSNLLAGVLPCQSVLKIPIAAPACGLAAPACSCTAPACGLSVPACGLSAIAPSCGCGCGCGSGYGSYYY